MTKQETIQMLHHQLPGFYSVDQVINMINSIEEPYNQIVDRVSVLEEDFHSVVDEIRDLVYEELHCNGRDYVDLNSAELYLENYNRICVEKIDLEIRSITEMVSEQVFEVLNKYVIVIEKSEELETTNVSGS